MAEEKELVEKLEDLVGRMEKRLGKRGAIVTNNMQTERPVSTIPVPEVPPTEFTQTRPRINTEESTLAVPPAPEAGQRAMYAPPPPDDQDNQDAGTTRSAVTAGEPIPGYDRMTVGEVLKAVKDLNADERNNVLTYERNNKNRTQVVDALENWNG